MNNRRSSATIRHPGTSTRIPQTQSAARLHGQTES
jgi:hypothetical protein